MSKDAWFREFERLEAEHPEKSDMELGNLAQDALVDRMAEQADRLSDEAKEGPADYVFVHRLVDYGRIYRGGGI